MCSSLVVDRYLAKKYGWRKWIAPKAFLASHASPPLPSATLAETQCLTFLRTCAVPFIEIMRHSKETQ